MVSEAKQKELKSGFERQFDDWLAKAEKGKPRNDGDNKAFDAALRDYQKNPLVGMVSELQEMRKSQVKAGAKPEDANDYYNYKINELRKNAINGADGNYVDPAVVEASQQTIMNSLQNFDIPGAIRALVLSIPFVGDFLGAAGKVVMSGFKMSFEEAQDKIALERMTQGALASGLGVPVDINTAKKFANTAHASIQDSNFTPGERAPTIMLDVAFNDAKMGEITDAKVKEQVQELQKSGQLSGDMGTARAVELLDPLMANIPGAIGKSIVKKETAARE